MMHRIALINQAIEQWDKERSRAMEIETQTEKYNGWTNYETWCVNLWMTNDEGSYSAWRETAQEIYEDAEHDSTFSRMENAEFALADHMKQCFAEEIDTTCLNLHGMYLDLLNASLSEVNWHEIAKAFLEDVR